MNKRARKNEYDFCFDFIVWKEREREEEYAEERVCRVVCCKPMNGEQRAHFILKAG